MCCQLISILKLSLMVMQQKLTLCVQKCLIVKLWKKLIWFINRTQNYPNVQLKLILPERQDSFISFQVSNNILSIHVQVVMPLFFYIKCTQIWIIDQKYNFYKSSSMKHAYDRLQDFNFTLEEYCYNICYNHACNDQNCERHSMHGRINLVIYKYTSLLYIL